MGREVFEKAFYTGPVHERKVYTPYSSISLPDRRGLGAQPFTSQSMPLAIAWAACIAEEMCGIVYDGC